jgi:hypothetical protein
VKLTRISARAASCAHCGKSVTGFRATVMRCAKCGVKVHQHCVAAFLSTAAASSAYHPSVAGGNESGNRAVNNTSGDSSGQINDQAAGGDGSGLDVEDDDEDADPVFDGGLQLVDWSAYVVQNARHARGRSGFTEDQRAASAPTEGIRDAEAADLDGAPLPELIYFKYIRFGAVTAAVSLAGFGVKIGGLTLSLHPIIVSRRVMTWDQLFLRVRRHVVSFWSKSLVFFTADRLT